MHRRGRGGGPCKGLRQETWTSRPVPTEGTQPTSVVPCRKAAPGRHSLEARTRPTNSCWVMRPSWPRSMLRKMSRTRDFLWPIHCRYRLRQTAKSKPAISSSCVRDRVHTPSHGCQAQGPHKGARGKPTSRARGPCPPWLLIPTADREEGAGLGGDWRHNSPSSCPVPLEVAKGSPGLPPR